MIIFYNLLSFLFRIYFIPFLYPPEKLLGSRLSSHNDHSLCNVERLILKKSNEISISIEIIVKKLSSMMRMEVENYWSTEVQMFGIVT